MTIVAAAKFKDKIIIGADSLLSDGDRKYHVDNFCKIVEISPDLWIAFAGTVTMYHILKKLQKKRGRKPNPPKDAHSCHLFTKPIFDEYKETITDMLTYDPHDEDGAQLLIITKTKMFVANETNAEEHIKWCSIGSGQDVSDGALYATYPNPNCVKKALDAACYLCKDCGGEIVVKEMV